MSTSDDELLDSALEKYRRGDYEEAERIANILPEMSLNRPKASCLLGMIRYRQQSFESALQYYSQAIQQNPSYVNAYINRSMALIETGCFEQALDDLNTAVSLGANMSAYFYRGRVFLYTSRYDLAISDFSSALQCISNTTDEIVDKTAAILHRGIARILNANFDSGIEDLDAAAVDHVPFRNDAIKWKGYAMLCQDRADDALICFDELARDDSNVDAIFWRGRCLIKLNRYEDAIHDLTRAIVEDPENHEVYHFRSIAFARLGKLFNSGKDLARAYELCPTDYRHRQGSEFHRLGLRWNLVPLANHLSVD